MFERELRELSFVPRWSVLRRTREQSVAEHSFYVALYTMQLAELVGWHGDRGRLARSALVHDLPEAATGDVPGPCKRMMMEELLATAVERKYMESRFPDDYGAWKDGQTDQDVRSLIKAGDLLDELMFLQTESQLGNKNVGRLDRQNTPLGNSWLRLRRLWDATPLLRDSDGWSTIEEAVRTAAEELSDILTDAPHILCEAKAVAAE